MPLLHAHYIQFADAVVSLMKSVEEHETSTGETHVLVRTTIFCQQLGSGGSGVYTVVCPLGFNLSSNKFAVCCFWCKIFLP
jgi:hypothetical protein